MRTIQLHGKYGSGKLTIVDQEDYQELSKYRWHVSKCGYVVRAKRGGGIVRMHRQIMNPPNSQVVDHINHDKLDNRRRNLRICTVKENNQNNPKYAENESKYKGVYRKGGNYWSASITVEGIVKYLGSFASEEEAARAYDYYAVRYFGDFASLNIPEDEPKKPLRMNVFKRNTSGYRGVFWSKTVGKWFAKIVHQKKSYYLGLFECKHDAARMYNFWALDLYGEKAVINIINEGDAD